MTDDSPLAETRLGPVARRLSATERVLCVEDEPDIAAFLRAYFRAAGYDFVHIDPTSASEVIDALVEHEPDAVLLDVRLRGFWGTEAHRLMRSDDRWALVPVIMVSANASTDPGFEPSDGLDAFVSKPFNTNSLADLVRQRIDKAAGLAAGATDPAWEMFGPEYLLTRLADEIAVAGPQGSFAFAIIDLRTSGAVTAEVGADGFDFLVRSLLSRARGHLPADAVFARTETDEVGVVLPGMGAREAYSLLLRTIEDIEGDFRFAGGAVVPVSLTGGVAAYPANATDPDGLFMAADAAMADATDDGAVLKLAR